MVYFAALGLSIIDMPLTGKEKEDVVEYIYSLQVFFGGENLSCSLRDQAGFLGSSYLGLPYESGGYDLARHSTCSNAPCHCTQATPYLGHVQGHIAMTYCGVLTLYSLGDDLGRIDKESIIHGRGKIFQSLDAIHSLISQFPFQVYGNCNTLRVPFKRLE